MAGQSETVAILPAWALQAAATAAVSSNFLPLSVEEQRQAGPAGTGDACRNYTHVYIQNRSGLRKAMSLYVRSPAPPGRLVPHPPCTRRRRQRPLQKRRRESRPQCHHTITPNHRFNLRSILFVAASHSTTTGDPRRMEVSVRAQAVAVKGGVMPPGELYRRGRDADRPPAVNPSSSNFRKAPRFRRRQRQRGSFLCPPLLARSSCDATMRCDARETGAIGSVRYPNPPPGRGHRRRSSESFRAIMTGRPPRALAFSCPSFLLVSSFPVLASPGRAGFPRRLGCRQQALQLFLRVPFLREMARRKGATENVAIELTKVPPCLHCSAICFCPFLLESAPV
jgi:hypothetical protein